MKQLLQLKKGFHSAEMNGCSDNSTTHTEGLKTITLIEYRYSAAHPLLKKISKNYTR
jgi:hypothetical protein